MNILIACEFSGIVRDAFLERGHNAWSCDLESCEGDSSKHLIGDARLHLGYGWDMIIAHPPCTWLCNSGVRWLYERELWPEMISAAALFNDFQNCNIPKIVIENPIPHGFATYIIGSYTQIIQPWMFGHGETKATCLWLKNLPRLKPTNIVSGRSQKIHKEPPGPYRAKNRSRTYLGIAKAMADQWG